MLAQLYDNSQHMGKQIIINHTKHEIRIALLQGSSVNEIFYERERDKSVVGNIFKGKVLKVLPGMESAFIDVGLEKAAFLYVDDIRTDPEKIDIESDGDNGNGNNDKHNTSKKSNRQKNNISSLIKEGQDIMVQVSKGPIGNKGARITCNITLPGRNLVFMPHVNNVGVSRQIRDEKERNRLRKIVSSIKPENTGFIVRTVATSRSEEEFRHDVEYLLTTWHDAEKKFKTYRSPAILFEDLNLTFRTIRDMLAPDVEALVIDDSFEYEKIKKYLSTYLPHYSHVLKLYSGKSPIFDHFGITHEIDRAMSRKVWLKSGGHLVIDQSEALTAIDVNTGRFTGSDSHEKTILITNMESAIEIVHQLKLRDIGGIIIIDFIDMEAAENREKVFRTLKNELKKDKAKTKVLPISEIGLVEMTRKRNRENLGRFLRIQCPYCDGTARVLSPSSIIYEIFREVSRLALVPKAPQNLLLGLHPDVAEYLEIEEIETYRSMERLIKGTISLQTSDKFHYEQFELLEI